MAAAADAVPARVTEELARLEAYIRRAVRRAESFRFAPRHAFPTDRAWIVSIVDALLALDTSTLPAYQAAVEFAHQRRRPGRKQWLHHMFIRHHLPLIALRGARQPHCFAHLHNAHCCLNDAPRVLCLQEAQVTSETFIARKSHVIFASPQDIKTFVGLALAAGRERREFVAGVRAVTEALIDAYGARVSLCEPCLRCARDDVYSSHEHDVLNHRGRGPDAQDDTCACDDDKDDDASDDDARIPTTSRVPLCPRDDDFFEAPAGLRV